MVYVIRQGDDGWQAARGEGDTLELIGEPQPSYDAALALLTSAVSQVLAEQAPDGLLADVWDGATGIAFSTETGDGRDFTGCDWSSRDPAVSLLPLMFQDKTDMGHYGAELAGFIESIDTSGDTPTATGRFYDSDVGREARDKLLGGAHFGVSVDCGSAETEFECTEYEEDDFGSFCVDGSMRFLSYEIIGLTMTPFPAFAEARITLGGGAAPAADDAAPDAAPAVAASLAAVAPPAPPAGWLALPEPQLGEPFLGGELGDEFLVDQGGGRLGCPLTITDDGRVYGHVATWGDCHVGYEDQCVSPPSSATDYAHFHVGEVICAGGERVAAGTLVVGCDHADASLFADAARDHYANAGLAWAQVRCVDGDYGPWVSGALRSDLTPEQVRVLRASALSGDWRRRGASMEMIGVLAVSGPGFGITRQAIVASGLGIVDVPRLLLRSKDGQPTALVASGLVRRCSDCEQRRAAGAARADSDDELKRLVRTIERRTRHLIPHEMAATAARIRSVS